jgi:DNA-binding GntR family transcriptional regulator
MVMHRDQEQPNTRHVQSASAAGPAVEDHGRVVTTNIQAAAFYRQAQQAADASVTVKALRNAVRADPGFGIAVADLAAITEAPPSPTGGRPMNWERHHIEVVSTAAAGNVSRATDLLREHLASVGCDPLAVRIVACIRRRAGYRDGLEDFSGQIPGCHPASRQS